MRRESSKDLTQELLWRSQVHHRVAREKAGAGLLQLGAAPGAVVLGADTEVVLGDEVFGKPVDAADAAAMLRRLAGREHRVITAVWCVSAGREERAVNESAVEFGSLSERQIAAYVASGEPMGRAGAYAIQGRAGRYIPRIEGCYYNVVGLPLARLLSELHELGWSEGETSLLS